MEGTKSIETFASGSKFHVPLNDPRLNGLCLKSPKSFLDRVSTGSGSDLVSDQHARFF
jgi:hypothetical protein